MKVRFNKLALFATAAFVSVGTSAYADDLADLKKQIEDLNGRISQLESTPSLPAGYQLMSVSQAPAIIVPTLEQDPGLYRSTATTIGILPTADVPASTNIQWSGYVRTSLVYFDGDLNESDDIGDVDSIDILTRAELKVVGTTDTAVGEVGALIKMRVDVEGLGDEDVYLQEGYGYWKMTPELTFGGGYTGSLANIGYGYDGACTCYVIDNAPVALDPGDRTQLRLSYASGPLLFAVALEDADISDPDLGVIPPDESDTLGASAELKYLGDAFSAEVSAGWWDGGDVNSDAHQVGVGAQVGLGDMAAISVAAGMGQDFDGGDYWKATILGIVTMTESVRAELGFGYANYDLLIDATDTGHYDADVMAVQAGIYYDPVSQLTLGLEAEWQKWDSVDIAGSELDAEVVTAGLVSIFRF